VEGSQSGIESGQKAGSRKEKEGNKLTDFRPPPNTSTDEWAPNGRNEIVNIRLISRRSTSLKSTLVQLQVGDHWPVVVVSG